MNHDMQPSRGPNATSCTWVRRLTPSPSSTAPPGTSIEVHDTLMSASVHSLRWLSKLFPTNRHKGL